MKKISICCLTYNHELFIEQTIKGFLNQSVINDCEIIIIDDCSTDFTASIIDIYQKKHPDIIKFIKNNTNQGVKKSFKKALDACIYEYTAICDGDDLWTDKTKLQTQIEILNTNKKHIATVHRFNIIDQHNNITESSKMYNYSSITLPQLIENFNIQASTIFFRTGVLLNAPTWFWDNLYDVPFYYFLLLNGPINTDNSIRSNYRRHSGNITAKRNIELEELGLKMLDIINKETHFKYNSLIKHKIALTLVIRDLTYGSTNKLIVPLKYKINPFKLTTIESKDLLSLLFPNAFKKYVSFKTKISAK